MIFSDNNLYYAMIVVRVIRNTFTVPHCYRDIFIYKRERERDMIIVSDFKGFLVFSKNYKQTLFYVLVIRSWISIACNRLEFLSKSMSSVN